MGKNRYYLIGRNKNNNSVQLIQLNQFLNFNTLEEIDAFTTRFESHGHLSAYLISKGIIDSYDDDIFIVSRSGDNIKFYDCLYEKRYPIFNQLLKEKCRGEMNVSSVCCLLDQYSDMMAYDNDFRAFNLYGLSRIYKKFIDYYRNSRDVDKLKSNKYRDGSWALSSYPLVRNIIDTFYKYNEYRDVSPLALIDYFKRIDEERLMSLTELKNITDKDYMVGQSSLFDEDKDTEVDKLSLIGSFLDNVKSSEFIISEKVRFNSRGFILNDPYYKTLFDKLLPDEFLENMRSFLKHKHELEVNMTYDLVSLTSILDGDKSKILKLLSDNSLLLNRVYSFVLLYNKCCIDNKVSGKDGLCKRKSN